MTNVPWLSLVFLLIRHRKEIYSTKKAQKKARAGFELGMASFFSRDWAVCCPFFFFWFLGGLSPQEKKRKGLRTHLSQFEVLPKHPKEVQ
jgi:hypothetical protein